MPSGCSVNNCFFFERCLKKIHSLTFAVFDRIIQQSTRYYWLKLYAKRAIRSISQNRLNSRRRYIELDRQRGSARAYTRVCMMDEPIKTQIILHFTLTLRSRIKSRSRKQFSLLFFCSLLVLFFFYDTRRAKNLSCIINRSPATKHANWAPRSRDRVSVNYKTLLNKLPHNIDKGTNYLYDDSAETGLTTEPTPTWTWISCRVGICFIPTLF